MRHSDILYGGGLSQRIARFTAYGWDTKRRRQRKRLDFVGRVGFSEQLEPRLVLAPVVLINETSPSIGIIARQVVYDDVGLDWTGSDASFDDSAWLASAVGGPNGIGAPLGIGQKYAGFASISAAAMVNTTNTSFLRIPFNVTDAARYTELTLNMRVDDGFIAYINGQEVQRFNVAGNTYPAFETRADSAVADANATFTTYDISAHVGVLRDGVNILAIRGFDRPVANQPLPLTGDFLIQATLSGDVADLAPTANDDAVSYRTDATDPVINVLANDISGTFPIDPATVEIIDEPENGTVTVNPNGTIGYSENVDFVGVDTFTYRVRDTSPEPSPNGPTVSIPVISSNAPHRRLVPAAAPAVTWTGSGAFDDATWLVGTGGIGYDTDAAVDYEPYFAGGPLTMQNVNASAMVRYPFTVPDPTEVVAMRLLMRWEDGFVAWINGIQVAAQAAPTPLLFNSAGNGGARAEAMVIVQDTYTVDLMLPGLVLRPGTGANILAIQPELIVDQGLTGNYSNEATVTVTVTGPGPFAADDAASTIGLASVSILVLDNDQVGFSGAAIRPETLALVQTPSNGAAAVEPKTGRIRYTPNPGFSGEDTFTYRVRDAAPVGGSVTTELIPARAVWKYLDNGSNQGTAWRAAEFNDSTWASGPAELGYGDGDEATVVSFGPNASNKYITTYFRRTFDVPSASAVLSLNLRLTYDDGAVAYINGTEVARVNLPTSTINYQTPTLISLEELTDTIPLTGQALSVLRSGTNTIAVEVHQNAPTGSDLSFDLQLLANVVAPTGNPSNVATVTVTVIPSTEPPTAADDSATVKHDRTVSIAVLANDTPGGNLIDAASVAIARQPARGSVSVRSDGQIVYLPGPLFVGDDDFGYTVRDVDGRTSNVATVNVTITNDAPTTNADAYYVEEDDVLILPAAFGVLANDTDDGFAALTAIVTEAPARGQLELGPDGAIRYTPNADLFGLDTFCYRVTDEIGAFSDEDVTIQVLAMPDAPRATDDEYATAIDTPLRLGVVSPEPLTYVSSGATWRFLDDGSDQGIVWRERAFDDAAWFSGVSPLGYGNGTEATVVRFGDDPNDRNITTYFRRDFDVADAARVYSLTLELLRDDGATVYLNGVEVARTNLEDEATFDTLAFAAVVGEEESRFFPFDLPTELLVDGMNSLAVEVHQSHTASSDLAFDLNLFGDVAGPITDSVLANDDDVDGDSMTAVLVSPPAHGVLAFEADGSFVYTPESGFSGVDSFTYRALDGERLSNLATVTIRITASPSGAADFNQDGVVDVADLAVVVADFGTAEDAAWESGDADGDGRVGLLDMLAVREALGSGNAASSAAGAVVTASRRENARSPSGERHGAAVETTEAPAIDRRAASARRAAGSARANANQGIVDRAIVETTEQLSATASRLRRLARAR